jgi:DNA-binding MarR family transcriptional regulator
MFRSLRSAHSRVAAAVHQETGFSDSQCLILLAIAKGAGSQATLVKETDIDRSTASEIVRRLIRDGLVVRLRSADDHRAYRVNLTKSGKAAVTRLRRKLANVETGLLASLSAPNQFISNLERLG